MNVFNQASNGLTGAMGTTQGIANMGFGNINQFMNPYVDQVMKRSRADLDQSRQMALNDVGAQASAAGAFGGSRHGLVEAATNREFADATADLSSNLRMNGYNTALGAAQADAGLRLNAANQLGNLSNMGFGMGQAVQGMQNMAGSQQQAINQALIDAGRQQFAGYQQAPYQGLSAMVSATGGAPIASTETRSSSPGLLGMLSGGASILGTLGGAGLLPFCWVSRAAFGADNPEWLKVRQWMLTKSPRWLFDAYVTHGPKLAEWIERNPVMKPVFRAGLRRLVG